MNLHKLHPKWKFATLKVHAGKLLTRMDELKRWEKDIIRGGTKFDSSKAIKKWTLKNFNEARERKSPVSNRNLQEWALQASQQFKDLENFSFIASQSWIDNFKKEYNIVQRKVTSYIKPSQQKSLQDIYQLSESFQNEIQILTSSTNLDFVINTDQMGCEYRTPVERTLNTVGEKRIEVYLGDINKVTHTYTVQYSITASGRLLPKVFVCLQEISGNFGPRISNHMENLLQKCKNIYIICSKSGKLSSHIFTSYLENVLKPYVSGEKFTLIIDSWSGQKNESLFDCFKTESGNNCIIKYIPPGCTMYCQPLDTYLHRQIKLFLKKLQNNTFLIEHNRQLNTRDDAVIIHSLIHHQLSAPVFRKMIQYAWFSSKLITERDVFVNVNEILFFSKQHTHM